MGWSKRGNGRSYDSLNGYGCIIGFLSGKILDYGTRNRKCKLCSNGHPKTDHDCRENFHGSAKAMEPNVGAALVNGSKILKSTGLSVRVVVGDEDSSTIASVRRGTINKIFKLSDKNHLQKSFQSDLYKLKPKYKELARKNTIPHLKKCFNYAISQNKTRSSKLASILKSIPDHFFNHHENCGDWCKRGAFNDTSSQKVVLKDPELYTHLYNLFGKYANNAHKIAFAASSQANESVNNIMAHKAPKSQCYSMSESSDYRYASAVCSKNDGESHLLEVYKILTLSPGKNTELYASRYDKKRRDRAKKAKLLSAKVRRNLLAENREKLRKKNEKTEGLQYESNCGFTNDNNINEVVDANIASICQDNFLITLDNCDIVYFDLETSGFGKSNEILQIAAMYEEHEFSIYINPTKEISSEASLHTGLRNISGQLYLRDKKVETVPLKDALSSFLKFLDLSPKPCVLVAHNSSFDSSFIRAVIQCNMILEFKKIAGFSDSLSLFKKRLATRKGPGQFKLGTLAKDFLKIESTENFHEALYDVKILKQLVLSVLNIEKIYENTKSWTSLLTHTREEEKSKIMLLQLKPLKTVLTPGILKKMAIAKMTYELLTTTFNHLGENGIIDLMSSKLENGKPTVTKNKRIINTLINFLKPKIE
ncbi:LOW QUALITY PROTEIN: uncharacterized protein LOC141537002 [Cotesia typhae]|uniref:LOW QUALITY PROTEIN: uncharacterized protein LOC141537002 n=1 Tax=Cotesia typhae TaxID=2053667 RepID=UPI003D68C2BB